MTTETTYKKFWTQLLARAQQQGVTTHAGVRPSSRNFIRATALSDFHFDYIAKLRAGPRVEFWWLLEDAAQTYRVYDYFFAQRDAIEQEFGGRLTWERRVKGGKSATVRFEVGGDGLASGEDGWPASQDAMIDAMDQLDRTFRPRISIAQQHCQARE